MHNMRTCHAVVTRDPLNIDRDVKEDIEAMTLVSRFKAVSLIEHNTSHTMGTATSQMAAGGEPEPALRTCHVHHGQILRKLNRK
jgi:D-tyrosyl-tRNA(Tyr) deacylase